MSEQSNKKKKDEVRVVEEPVDEVVRLDVAESGSVQKRAKVLTPIEASSAPVNLEDAPEKRLFDPELDWLEENYKTGGIRVPIGWFVLLGAGILGVLVWVVLQTMLSRGIDENPEAKNDQADRPTMRINEEPVYESELSDAEGHFARMESVVGDFLAAETIEEKIKLVRHPERVLPLMKKHYQTHPIEPLTFKETLEYHVVSLEQEPFIALRVDVEEGQSVPVLLEDLPQGLLVDWESFVCYQPISPEVFLEQRPTDSFSFRVYAQEDGFYTHEFADEKEYQCYRLAFRNSKAILYGYVKRGSKVAQKFRKSFPEGRGKTRLPLILKVRFLEGGKADRSVLIEDLQSKLWAHARNPDEVSATAEVE